MSDTISPENLNWVQARADCSLQNIFKALELGAREDVEQMMSRLGSHDQIKFSVVPGNKRFSVIRIDDPMTSISIAVDFIYARDEITVQTVSNDQCGVLFTVGITLDNNGRCKLKVKDAELEQWQVRRMALERLFFGPRSIV
jgi:hypothetical protein